MIERIQELSGFGKSSNSPTPSPAQSGSAAVSSCQPLIRDHSMGMLEDSQVPRNLGGGTTAYSISHSGAHFNATRELLVIFTHNDKSRSLSAMSSLSAANGSTDRRPRRLTRHTARRGAPGNGTFLRSTVQQNCS